MVGAAITATAFKTTGDIDGFFDCEFEGKFPYPDSCKKYVECMSLWEARPDPEVLPTTAQFQSSFEGV